MKTIFFGSSAYCLPIIEALHRHTHLVGIITREEKPVGRKRILTPSPPHEFAKKANIPVMTPKDKKDLLSKKDEIQSYAADIAIVADYGIIIPKEIFSLPTYGTVNVHFSKLPDLRGASPVQFTLLRGDTTAWITIQQMAESLDTGDILWQKGYAITEKETTESLYKKLFTLAGLEISTLLYQIASRCIPPRPQDESAATYTRKLTRDDGFIPFDLLLQATKGGQPSASDLLVWPLYDSVLDTLQPAHTIIQKRIFSVFQALSPWPGIWTLFPSIDPETSEKKNIRLKILDLTYTDSTTLTPIRVQEEGKTPTPWETFCSQQRR